MANAHADQVCEIGFNQSVLVGGRELHVQTEVLFRDQLIVRTTINDGGVVRLAERLVYEGEPSGVDAIRAVAEAQHTRHVQELTEESHRGAH